MIPADFDPSEVVLRVVPMDQILNTPELLAVARKLTLKPGSGMNSALDIYTRISHFMTVDALGIFALYRGTYIGWCMLTAESDGVEFRAQGDLCTHVYVQTDYRRQGVGTQLMNKAIQLAGTNPIKVYGYNNYPFFHYFLENYSNITGL